MASASVSLAPRARFTRAGAFQDDLKRRVDLYFEHTRQARTGGWRMRANAAVLLGWLAASYALLVFAHPVWWVAVPLAVSVGLAMAGVGFGVMHDGNHGSAAASPRENRLFAFTSDLLGGSSFLWRHKHNVLHHSYTNVCGLDTDIEPGVLLRFAPAQPRRALHRFQHLYVWLLYAVFPLRWWLVDDFHQLATGRMGEGRFARPRGWDLIALLGGKALFLGWAFVLPLLLHPWGSALPLMLVAVATLGTMLAVVFQLAHCVGEAEFHDAHTEPPTGDWAAHQVATTVDFARGNRLLGWYMGGLNFQIEHHLFPRVSHVHYAALAPMVEETCREHGVPYRAQPSFLAAVRSNVRWLRQLGRAAGDERRPAPILSATPGG